MCLCRDIEFTIKLDFRVMSVGNEYFLKIQYLDKRTFVQDSKLLENSVKRS
jgi:hypothetical protein